MERETDHLVVFYKPAVLKDRAVLGVLMSPLFAWFVWYSWSVPMKTRLYIMGMILGPPCTLIMFSIAAGSAWFLISKSPAVEITEEGIIYRYIWGVVKRLSWSEIGSFQIREVTYGHKSFNALDILSSGNRPKTLITIATDDLTEPVHKITDAFDALSGRSLDGKQRQEID